MSKFSSLKFIAVSAALLLATVVGAEAASYKSLVSKGYKTGKLTQTSSGGYGWIVSKGDTRYFCKLNASMAYVSSTKMVSILPSGRKIPLDRKAFEKSLGNKKTRIPNLSDLEAGRVDPADVGTCRQLK